MSNKVTSFSKQLYRVYSGPLDKNAYFDNIEDFEDVVKLDLEYIDNWSIGLDFKILFKTIAVVFHHGGAK